MQDDTISNANTMQGGGTGTVLAGRYRILRQLGAGGMGSVWLAEDTQLDNKRFAIKMLPTILVSNKRAYRQLKDEALVAMKLTHPNIVTLRAFEENNGNPFLVMDYIDGQTLDDYLAENGKLTEEESLRVLRPIAAALDYAHGEGVVHRDVKPANVMIRKDGHPFILDFGIAREIQETLTRVTGKLSSGTLLYMSPEQLHGAMPRKEQDIYSFAAMVYECLKGEPPFCRGQIEHQIDNDMPEPLLGGTQLVASVMAGLAKKPEDRPKSCAAVLERKIDFNRVERVDGDGGARRPAEPPNGDDLSHKERKGSCVGKVLGLLAILAALGGGAWYYHKQQESVRQEQARIAAERKAQEEVPRTPEEGSPGKAAPEPVAVTNASDEVSLDCSTNATNEVLVVETSDQPTESTSESGSVSTSTPSPPVKAAKIEEVHKPQPAETPSTPIVGTPVDDMPMNKGLKTGIVITNNAQKVEQDKAIKARDNAMEEHKNAKKLCVDANDPDGWNAAVKRMERAREKFNQKKYAEARAEYDNAAMAFERMSEKVKKQ